nr:hypothetical protein [Micromonospora sp. DSM 115978]
MRHLWSFLAGLVAAPLAWVLTALGQDGSARTVARWTEVGTYNTANLIEPAVYLAVAGILLGVLGTLRFSPLGAVTAGLLMVGPYIGYFVDPFAVRDAVPADWSLFGDPMPLLLPVENGTLFLVGAALLMAALSVQRWRRWPVAGGPPPMATGSSGSSGSGGSSGSDDPTRTDLPPVGSGDPDTDPPTLGYPRPMPPPPPPPPSTAPPPSPLRRESGSPWSAPPRANTPSDSTPT